MHGFVHVNKRRGGWGILVLTVVENCSRQGSSSPHPEPNRKVTGMLSEVIWYFFCSLWLVTPLAVSPGVLLEGQGSGEDKRAPRSRHPTQTLPVTPCSQREATGSELIYHRGWTNMQ